jgi:hypothetical protein
LHNDQIWVDNSGYGEVGVVSNGRFVSVARLPGWTRGLCLLGKIAFVGTSRVIPRFRQYAPGVDLDKSECAVHAVDIQSGHILGSVTWPAGNQIFAVDWLPNSWKTGFPFLSARRNQERDRQLFYAFTIGNSAKNGTEE